MGKNLRDYQLQAIKNIESDLNSGYNTLLLNMSMGLGKTFTAVKAEEKLNSKKTFWVTEDSRLLEQSAMAFIRDKFDDKFADEIDKIGFIEYCRNGGTMPNTGHKMSIVKADLFDISGDIVFCSAQTLYRRLEKMDADMCDIMIVDEAHCFGSKSLYEGISHFNTRLRLGLSGTPIRNDGVMMGDMFQKQTFEYGMSEGIKNGYLCELDAIRIKTNVNLDKVHTQMGDFNEKELANQIDTLARNNLIADSYLKYCNGRQAIGYGVNINHCLNLAEAFREKGINAEAVSSDDERTSDSAAKIKAYKQGKLDVIFNVNILSKGFDHADTGCTIAAAPTKSLVRYLQGPAGRGSRLKSDEFVKKFGQNCIIIDVVDNTTRHNLVNAFEIDKQKPLEDRCFISQDKKDKILADRLAKQAVLTHEQKEDEKVSLIALPKVISTFSSSKMRQAATENQLRIIKHYGYDIQNFRYTFQQCNDIIGMQICSKEELEYLSKKGYETDGATKSHYSTIYYEHEIKNKQWQKQKR